MKKKSTKKSALLLYSIKRVIYFLPTLFIITLFAFWLTKLAPGDPAKGQEISQSFAFSKSNYERKAKSLNLHLPNFYFSFSPQSSPDTLYKIINKLERETQEKLLAQFGNWTEVSNYYNEIPKLEQQLLAMPDSIAPAQVIKVKSDLVDLYAQYKPQKISALLAKMEKNTKKDAELLAVFGSDFQRLKNNFELIKKNETPIKNWLPDFKWYGFQNQYHLWISGIMRGDFGKSYASFQPVWDVIRPALSWTLMMFAVALFFAFLISIPMGVFAAIKRGGKFDKITSFIAFLLFSLPVFWIGTAFLFFFTTPEYGMNWFDGMWQSSLPKSAPFFDRFMETSNHLVLPIVCMTYGSFAFLSRQMRGNMVEVLDKQYILTARAKGLSDTKVHWKHAFRNALFPIITILGGILPASITGAVVLEFIYQIPGMGWITLEAIHEQDWPVVFSVLLMGAILTLVGILLADILYAIADPRVSYEQK